MVGVLSTQFDPKISDKRHNLKIVERYIQENIDKNIDLVVFPEFFSTGIDHKSFQETPESDGSDTIVTLQSIAQEYNVNIIAGTVITKVSDSYYNTSFAINRAGKILNKYNKIHLYSYLGGTENQRITPGNEYIVVDFDCAKVGMCICFDFRYPLQFKKLTQMGAEIIVVPTFWLVENQLINSEKDKWLLLNKARAYDNMIYIVSSNACGSVDNNRTAIGNSCIVSPFGDILQNAGNESCAIYEKLDIDIVRKYKKLYPIANID